MDFVNASNQCLTEAERGSKQLIQNVTKQLLGFVCYKEGDRIACAYVCIFAFKCFWDDFFF